MKNSTKEKIDAMTLHELTADMNDPRSSPFQGKEKRNYISERKSIIEEANTVKNHCADDQNSFLDKEFNNLDLKSFYLDETLTLALEYRLSEIEKCFSSEAPLSVIILAGSTLEGVLLGLANNYPEHFNKCSATPKNKEEKVKKFHEWSLSNFIDVAKEVGLIETDVHQFSHVLRDFRNYIHPSKQVSTDFNPTMDTAKICLQVLKAAIHQININLRKPDA